MPQILPLNAPIQAPDGSTPVLPSAARTTTQSVDCANMMGAGVLVMVNVSANPGTLGSITLHIRSKDPVSGLYSDILVSAAITVVALATPLRVYPGIAVTANVSASDVVPHDFNIQVIANNANPMTYSVSACAIP